MVKEIQAINGPYPPTFNGIRNAIEACRYDQGLGVNEANNKLLIVGEDVSQTISISDSIEVAYEAAEIAHHFGIPHDNSLCQDCATELEDFERYTDAILS